MSNQNHVFRLADATTVQKKQEFSEGRIFTISYHGAKKAWVEEYETLYKYANGLGCTKMIDCFGGSGFLSLLAARTKLFEQIYLNELAYLTINYHYVMKNDSEKIKELKDRQILFKMRYGNENIQRNLFEEFLYYLYRLDEGDFKALKNSYKRFVFRPVNKNVIKNKKKKISIWVPNRRQVRKASVRKAVLFFEMQHYSFRGSGDYITKTKEPRDYIVPLKATHELYKNIKLSQLHYKKFMKQFLNASEALIILDCPYLGKTRVHKKSYACEMSPRQHRYLLQELTKQVYEAKVILCGYDNYMYNHYFQRFNDKYGLVWHNLRVLKLGKRKNNAVHEHIWINFEPTALLSSVSKKGKLMFESVDMQVSLKKYATKRKRKHIKKATFKKRDL